MSDADYDAFRDKVVNDPLWAADRLTELDAKVRESGGMIAVHLAELRHIDALRPPCPTCGGVVELDCPDCVDGKASIEQLVRLWNTVWNPRWDVEDRMPVSDLRGVKL